MKTNLGQLLKAVNVLDEASGLAPLNRQAHGVVQDSLAQLRAALPELWQLATAKSPPSPAAEEKTKPATGH